MGNKDRGHIQLLLDISDLHLHLFSQLGIQI